MKLFHIITFGCQMNKNDSEHLAGMFVFNGYQKTTDVKKANILILNTCAVREKAELRVYGQLAQINAQRKKLKLDQKIYLAGCMPAYNKEKIKKEIPYLEGFIDIEEARQYPAIRADDHKAWVSIMYGCDNFCSYCIVPYVRGRERSRTVDEIKNEIRELDHEKISYVCLLGQNVNSYCPHPLAPSPRNHMKSRGEGKIRFANLLEAIIQGVPKLKKIGFMTSHPKDLSDELIEVIAKYPKIDRELHLPVQAMNNRILKLMNRGYTIEEYKKLVSKLRKRVPSVRISTDLIVGFPTETEAEFQVTLNEVKESGFHRIITSAYSPREGTKAAEMEGQIEKEIKNRRLNELNEVIRKE
ncbi:MiaB/RimO family radical SAM methylthiotransferase [bacterium]|nr:MiaB/RimO family radical SAM methylthiotransferase [bacterium]